MVYVYLQHIYSVILRNVIIPRCPEGMRGNGVVCRDVVCETDNGGCSQNPKVQCYSQQTGQAICGECPTGYKGDGRQCTKKDYCADDQGRRCIGNVPLEVPLMCFLSTSNVLLEPSG